jgi:hypothetical protein
MESWNSIVAHQFPGRTDRIVHRHTVCQHRWLPDPITPVPRSRQTSNTCSAGRRYFSSSLEHFSEMSSSGTKRLTLKTARHRGARRFGGARCFRMPIDAFRSQYIKCLYTLLMVESHRSMPLILDRPAVWCSVNEPNTFWCMVPCLTLCFSACSSVLPCS